MRRRAWAFSTLTAENLPQQVLDCQYAVRGSVLIKAEKLQSQGHAMVPCNIGNPQAVGQDPLTFHRQVLAMLTDPSLARRADLYPDDARERANRYLEGAKGKMGAYSHSKGHLVFREDIAKFLTERDGVETDPDDIFLTDGASVGCKLVLQMAVRGPKDGVLLPIPQYPLYSASMTLLGGQSVPYFLDEEAGWGIHLSELERSVAEFKASGGTPRAIVVINPGNPTGQVLSRSSMEDVLRFAEREGLMVLADEVYQDNIHVDGKEWISMRKLGQELGTTVEIFSFHSTSKGVTGECGLRGGLLHCQNVQPIVKDQMYKLSSICLCSNVLGQAAMASVVNFPPPDGPSRKLFDSERAATHGALKRKAKMLTDGLNAIDGISCQPIEGAMYAFPKLTIKGYIMKKAISKATPADEIYCLEMVDRCGIITVPGSGFGQKPGTFHLRTTILPDEPTLKQCLEKMARFHAEHPNGWFN